MQLYIGLMSGTSMDGIDAALVDMGSNTLIAGITRPYSAEAQQFLQAVLNGTQTGLSVFAQLNTVLGQEFAYAVNQLLNIAEIKPEQIIAIGSHGQTICHDATAHIPYTLQLGCGHTLAELTGITVVADFRTRDLVLGGQGAPFAPIYHQALFASLGLPIAIVNVGGIANVTFLAPGEIVRGHDTGPGNCLMDAWIKTHLNKAYDANGAWGATGQVIAPLLSVMLDDPYFKLPAPKSLDKSYFSERWLAPYLQPGNAAHDVQATLLALTATSICNAIQASNKTIQQVAICGGGIHNESLINMMRHQLHDANIVSTQAFGVDPDFLEAMMFAWFAHQRLHQIPVDLTHITGARKPAILGAIYK